MEKFTLSSPIAAPSLQDFRVSRFDANPEEQYLMIAVKSNTGKIIEQMYKGEAAKVKIRQLNKADLSVKSLNTWIFEFLRADNEEFKALSGNIGGTPD